MQVILSKIILLAVSFLLGSLISASPQIQALDAYGDVLASDALSPLPANEIDDLRRRSAGNDDPAKFFSANLSIRADLPSIYLRYSIPELRRHRSTKSDARVGYILNTTIKDVGWGAFQHTIDVEDKPRIEAYTGVPGEDLRHAPLSFSLQPGNLVQLNMTMLGIAPCEVLSFDIQRLIPSTATRPWPWTASTYVTSATKNVTWTIEVMKDHVFPDFDSISFEAAVSGNDSKTLSYPTIQTGKLYELYDGKVIDIEKKTTGLIEILAKPRDKAFRTNEDKSYDVSVLQR